MTRPVTMITGGGRGIGAAIAVRLAGAGHDIAFCFRSDTEAAETVAAAVHSAGAACLAMQADVTSDDDLEAFFAATQRSLGMPTGLVNNAGATLHLGPLAETPPDTIRASVALNLTAVLLTCRHAARVMSTSRGGSGGAIVNVSSSAATLGSPGEYVEYAAAKAGVDALTVGLAKELAADGIRVNAVAPGIVRTGIHAAAGDPGRPDRLADSIPLGRPGEPDEVAAAVAWLLSSESSYASGAVLRLAGGR